MMTQIIIQGFSFTFARVIISQSYLTDWFHNIGEWVLHFRYLMDLTLCFMRDNLFGTTHRLYIIQVMTLSSLSKDNPSYRVRNKGAHRIEHAPIFSHSFLSLFRFIDVRYIKTY